MPARPKQKTRQNTFGQRVDELMRQRGWEQQDLAAHSEVPRSTVSRSITGRTRPDLETIYRLADALEASVEEFIGLALYDLTGNTVKLSGSALSTEELAAAVRAFPWLAGVVKDLGDMTPTEQRGLMAYLEAQKTMNQKD